MAKKANTSVPRVPESPQLPQLPELPELQNDILAALSIEAQKRLSPFLQLLPLSLGTVLYEQDAPITQVYFPAGAIISLQYVLEDGTATEVSTVGKEGFLGSTLVLGSKTIPGRAIVQGFGNSYRLPIDVFMDELNRRDELQRLALHYTQALITQMTQTAICNQYHSLDQQLCRWLLIALDRVPGDHLHMSQILNVSMLGVRRQGVNEAAQRLQALGAIKYANGYVTVLDRAQLEALCCECYRVVKTEVERLLGAAAPEHAVVHGGINPSLVRHAAR